MKYSAISSLQVLPPPLLLWSGMQKQAITPTPTSTPPLTPSALFRCAEEACAIAYDLGLDFFLVRSIQQFDTRVEEVERMQAISLTRQLQRLAPQQLSRLLGSWTPMMAVSLASLPHTHTHMHTRAHTRTHAHPLFCLFLHSIEYSSAGSGN